MSSNNDNFEALHRCLLILEKCPTTSSDDPDQQHQQSTPRRKSSNIAVNALVATFTGANRKKARVPSPSVERKRKACLELRDLLAAWDTQKIQRHEQSRAIAALFQSLDHREQSVRFAADQALDAIFRKFVLKFQPQKVIAFLLTELNNRKHTNARALCAALQKLVHVIGCVRAARAGIYNVHFLNGIGECLQRAEESVQLSVQRHFPALWAELGPFVVGESTAENRIEERAIHLLDTAMANLEFAGAKSRAASTVIAHLAQYVPSILHKSFYQLSKIISEADDKEHKSRLAGALNTFRQMLPLVLENLTDNAAKTLQLLLANALRCVYSVHAEVVVAALEFLQQIVAQPNAAHLGQFNPQMLLLLLEQQQEEKNAEFDLKLAMCGGEGASGLSPNRQSADRAQSVDDRLTEVDTISVLSMCTTGTSSSRLRSGWSSLDDLVGNRQMLGQLNIEHEDGDDRDGSGDGGGEDTNADGGNADGVEANADDDEDDRFSVISAELFVDPLMNCFHQQPKTPQKSATTTTTAQNAQQQVCSPRMSLKPSKIRGGSASAPTTAATSGSMTPCSTMTIGSGQGRKPRKLEQQQPDLVDGNAAASIEQHWQQEAATIERQGIPLRLSMEFCNADELNFWLYSALAIGRQLLLAGPGRVHSDQRVRISHKILALDYIALVANRQLDLLQQPIFDDNDEHFYLSDLYAFIGHEDDNLALSALNFAFNMEKNMFHANPAMFAESTARKTKLMWHIKKTMHAGGGGQKRSPARLKALFHTFGNAMEMLCADDQLLTMACEHAFTCGQHSDYFLVKIACAKFLSRIHWTHATAHARTILQPECARMFLEQLFDRDPRVQKATLELLPQMVRNADRSTSLTHCFAAIPIPQCWEHQSTAGNGKIPILLGLDAAHYAFNTDQMSMEQAALCTNLSHVIAVLHAIAMQQFAAHQHAFVCALCTLMAHFPATNGSQGFAPAWLCATIDSGKPIEGAAGSSGGFKMARTVNSMGSTTKMPQAINLLTLLLECAECSVTMLDELATLLTLIGKLFAVISECLILRRSSVNFCSAALPVDKLAHSTNNSGQAVPMLWGYPSAHNDANKIDGGSTTQLKCQQNLVEQCTLLSLRVLNLYYAIVAEERVHNQQEARQKDESSKMAMIAASGESLMSGAAAILVRPVMLLSPSGSKLASDDPTAFLFDDDSAAHAASPFRPSHSPLRHSNSKKAMSLSLLIGTGVRQTRPSSFTQSQTLRLMESPLRNAFRAFVEHLDPAAHTRFRYPLECALQMFCAILEVADLNYIRTFLDEVLIYLRVLMDVSMADSARFVHQLLRCLFSTNAPSLNSKILRRNEIWSHHLIPSNDLIELHLLRPLNNFALFTHFVAQPEFVDAFIRNVGNWMLVKDQLEPPMLPTEENEQQQMLNQLLHQMEPFITHLLKHYTIINSVATRTAILNCICTLCLCNVRYELLDQNAKLKSRVLDQLKQCSPLEDAPLLPPIFTFIGLLVRIRFMKTLEIQNFLADIFARLTAPTCSHAIYAARAVLFLAIANEEQKREQPERHQQILLQIHGILLKQFTLTFRVVPEDSAEIWIILLRELQRTNAENWSKVVESFFTNFFEYSLASINAAHPAQSPATTPIKHSPSPHFGNQSDARKTTAAAATTAVMRQLFLHAILLGQQISKIAINRFLECIHRMFIQFASKIVASQQQQQHNDDDESTTTDDYFLQQFAQQICPLIFVLFTKLGEEQAMEEQTLLIEFARIAALNGKNGVDGGGEITKQMEEQAETVDRNEVDATKINLLLAKQEPKNDDDDDDDEQEEKEKQIMINMALGFFGRHIHLLLSELLGRVIGTEGNGARGGGNRHHLHVNNDDDSFSSTCFGVMENCLLFLLFTLHEAIRDGKSPSIINSLKRHITIDDGNGGNLSAVALLRLSHCSPSVWSFWSSLLFALDLVPEKIGHFHHRHCFVAMPSHCKPLLVQMIMEKVADSGAPTSAEHLLEQFLTHRAGGAINSAADSHEEFLAILLRVDNPKLFRTFVRKLPQHLVQTMLTEMERVFGVEEIMELHFSRFCLLLARSEKAEHASLLTAINDVNDQVATTTADAAHGTQTLHSARMAHVLHAYLHKQTVVAPLLLPPSNFNAKELAQLKMHNRCSNPYEFYKLLAAHAFSQLEFKQISSGLLALDDGKQIVTIITLLPPWPMRADFHRQLFSTMNERHKIGNWNGGKQPNEMASIVHEIVEQILLEIDNKTEPQICPEEKVFVLAEIACWLNLMDDGKLGIQNELFRALTYDDHHNNVNRGQCIIEAFLNNSFVLMFLQHAARRNAAPALPDHYFVALELFFSLSAVKSYFTENDCRTVRSLLLFLTHLWEFVEQKIPSWRRFAIDKSHWNVRIQAIVEEGTTTTTAAAAASLDDDDGEQHERLQKMFALVQRITFTLTNDRMVEQTAAVERAFRAILAGVSVAQRMALVPETALRMDWPLTIDVIGGGQRVFIPLIQIHMLNEPSVLKDFCCRALWLGWLSRAQFEDFYMSLYGVLSSTPTTSDELQKRAALDGTEAVHQQLLASSLAIEALANIMLQTLLYPQPGNPSGSTFVVKHRKRRENYPFLGTDYGKLALKTKALTNGITQRVGDNNNAWWHSNELFLENLEWEESPDRNAHYALGQTALYHLWSIAGMLEPTDATPMAAKPDPTVAEQQTAISSTASTPSTSKEDFTENASMIRPSTSDYLLAQSTELDTASSIRALHETFMHWLKPTEAQQLPLPILHSTLRSLALISDLFHDPALYKQTYATIKAALNNGMANQEQKQQKDPTILGYSILLLLKCASVLDWTELADSGEVSIGKCIESLVQMGLHSHPIASDQNEQHHHHQQQQQMVRCSVVGTGQFVRICTLHGMLYLVQSLGLEHLRALLMTAMDFVVRELQRMQHKLRTDILTECSTDLEQYQRLCWAFAFAVLQEALPIDDQHQREPFLRLVQHSFVDPRVPSWLKTVLTRGVEALVLHSSSYAPRFRQMALECLETYQLQPGHLPFSLSIYATCAYRELQAGGEYAYNFNKTFLADFQKLLNIFTFYVRSTSSTHSSIPSSDSKSLCIFEMISDLVSTVWAKESVIECIWTLLMPSANVTPPKSKTTPQKLIGSGTRTPQQSPSKHLPLRRCQPAPPLVPEFMDPLQVHCSPIMNVSSEPKLTTNCDANATAGEANNSPNLQSSPKLHQPLIPVHLQLSAFDQALMYLLHLIIRKIFAIDRSVCLELCANFLVNKMANALAANGEMVRCLCLIMLCSATTQVEAQNRVHFLLQTDPFGTKFSKAAFDANYNTKLVTEFIALIARNQRIDVDAQQQQQQQQPKGKELQRVHAFLLQMLNLVQNV